MRIRWSTAMLRATSLVPGSNASNWSARLEYLHIRANDVSSSVLIPGFLGVGTAAETAAYRNNIVRVGLNYRIGPRGGPGALETRVLPGSAYALNYDFLPSVAIPSDKAKSATRSHDGTAVARQPPGTAAATSRDKTKTGTRPHDWTVVARAGAGPQHASHTLHTLRT